MTVFSRCLDYYVSPKKLPDTLIEVAETSIVPLFYLTYVERETGITINRRPSIDFHGNQLHRGNSNSRLISVWYHSLDAPLFFLVIVNVSFAYRSILFFADL